MHFSQAAHRRLFATSHCRNIKLSTLILRDKLNMSEAVRIPRDGEYLFGRKLLVGIDTDILLLKRAKEVDNEIACEAASRC